MRTAIALGTPLHALWGPEHRKFEQEGLAVPDSPCRTAETNTTLQRIYTPVKIKQTEHLSTVN